jgi:hypothetical protein
LAKVNNTIKYVNNRLEIEWTRRYFTDRSVVPESELEKFPV